MKRYRHKGDNGATSIGCLALICAGVMTLVLQPHIGETAVLVGIASFFGFYVLVVSLVAYLLQRNETTSERASRAEREKQEREKEERDKARKKELADIEGEETQAFTEVLAGFHIEHERAAILRTLRDALPAGYRCNRAECTGVLLKRGDHSYSCSECGKRSGEQSDINV